MPLDRVLPLFVATLSWLGTLLLGLSERNLLFPLAATLVIPAALVLVDWLKIVRLPGAGANFAALLALAFCALETFQRWGEESQLLAVANLMIYLQFILVFQEKNEGRYWLLVLISALQVAVASALSLEMYFGGLLLIYLAVALLTLILFLFYRQHPEPGADAPAGPSAPPARWPLLDAPSTLVARPPGDPLPELISWAFVTQLLRMVAATLSLAVFVFLFVPRIGRPGWRPYTTGLTRETGFSESIALGDLGAIGENSEQVMRVQFLDGNTGYPYQLVGEPLLRGAVLPTYARGRWMQRATSQQATESPPDDLPPGSGDPVIQRTTIEPLDTDVLFCIYPVANVNDDKNLVFDVNRRRLLRRDRVGIQELNRTQYSFDVAVGGLVNGEQMTIAPAMHNDGLMSQLMDLPEGLTRVQQLADALVAEIPITDRVARVRAIEAYFRDDDRFRYTLHLPATPASGDPVEHFLFETQQGHCEYFASAAALLLRAAKVPCRLVVGFKGGDWNSLGRFYQVRQLHAHAWVEVFLGQRHLPRGFGAANGAWMRVDPTPSLADDLAADEGFWYLPSLRQWGDFSQFVWSNYVLGMNARRQSESIYEPIGRGVRQAIDRGARPEEWHRSARDLSAWLNIGFNWRAGVLAAIACGLLVALFGAARRLVRAVAPRWRAYRRRRALARGGDSRIEFYRRLQELLARQGWRRRGNQTPREFAAEVALRLSEPARRAGEPALTEVTEAFYQARFGREPLTPAESAAVNRALDDLTEALGRLPKGRVS